MQLPVIRGRGSIADNSRTGATGYIGGDLLYALFQAHPGWEYTCLVRNADKGAKVAAAYPKVRLVYGTLDSIELLEEEAGKADIIYRMTFLLHSWNTSSN